MFPCEARGARFSTLTSAFELNPKIVGCPRLDHYHKILSRFYEPLLLLKLLGQSRGDQKPKPHDLNSAQFTRRDFLRNLCHICDLDRGGDTCTAIGLADHDNFYGFWVASNKGKDEITAFLKAALALLRNVNELPETQLSQKEAEFMKFSVDFAKRRIVKEKNCLVNAVNECHQTLSKFAEAGGLREWLKSVSSYDDHLNLCTFAYKSRHSGFHLELQRWSIRQKDLLGPEKERNCFEIVRHFLGRLAHHIRAPKKLVRAAIDVSQLLQSCHVFAIDHIESVPPPEPDSHTNLNGILNRMLGKTHDERLEIEHGLSKFNAVNKMFERFPGEYRKLKPRVHAEVQVLEYFHQNKIHFVENDRFVACSKAACLCCEMYFRYHPARMVVPESHRNVWTNWGPPLVDNFSKFHGAGRQQLHILNNMIQEVRDSLISQVLGQSSVGHRYPDSKTDITELYSARYTLPPTKFWEKPSMTTCKDVSVEKSTQNMKDPIKIALINPKPLFDNNEESDDEDGGVLVRA